MRIATLLLALLLVTDSALAQTKPWSPEYKKSLRQASMRRPAEILRRNQAQQEAINMLFGPRGIPALMRPTDPWNVRRNYGGIRYRRMGGYYGGMR